MKKEILEQWNNTVIQVLSPGHGRKVIDFWNSIGVDTKDWVGNQLQAYYGIFDGDFNNYYTPSKNITILTLEQAIAIRDQEKPKTFPREMYCWNNNINEAQIYQVHSIVNNHIDKRNVIGYNDKTWITFKYAMEIEEYEKLYSKQPTKRLPTIEEVTKWFEENRIFKTKNEFRFRILGVATKATFPIELNRDHYTIEEFCTKFTDQNGNELYITE